MWRAIYHSHCWPDTGAVDWRASLHHVTSRFHTLLSPVHIVSSDPSSSSAKLHQHPPVHTHSKQASTCVLVWRWFYMHDLSNVQLRNKTVNTWRVIDSFSIWHLVFWRIVSMMRTHVAHYCPPVDDDATGRWRNSTRMDEAWLDLWISVIVFVDWIFLSWLQWFRGLMHFVEILHYKIFAHFWMGDLSWRIEI